MMKTLLIHTPENYTSVSSLTEPKAVQESMEKHETSYFETSVLTHARKRFMWLLFLMLSATVTGTIITRYENAFSAVPLLVSFIPMLMDTGGNCGSQSSTLIIRGLALNEIRPRDVFRIAFKEFRIALLVGTGLAVINGIRILIMYRDPRLALVVSLSLTATVILSKIIGCILPLGANPAYGSGNHGISSDHYSCGHLLYYYLLLHCHKDLCPCCVTCLFLLKINDPGTDLFQKLLAVADYDHSNFALFGFIHKEMPDLTLCDEIQHGADLIRQKELCPLSQRSCNTKPLHFSPGQLCRKTVHPVCLNAKSFDKVRRYVIPLLKHRSHSQPGINGLFRMLPDQLNRTVGAIEIKRLSVQQNLSAVRLLISRQYFTEGCFSKSAWRHKPYPLCTLCFQTEIF